MKILLVNQCAANKGDRTVLLYVLREFARNGVSRVWVSADNPGLLEGMSDYQLDMPVEFIPWGSQVSGASVRKLRALSNKIALRSNVERMKKAALRGEKSPSLRLNQTFSDALEDADAVVSTGGHHVTSLLVPEALSPQMHDIAVAAMRGRPVALWSQSVGPFTFTRLENREFVRWILGKARAIFTRDHKSLFELAALGVDSARVVETHESVIGLSDMIQEYAPPSERSPIVGISVYHVLRRSTSVQQNYVRSFAALVDSIVEMGCTPQFFPMEAKGPHDDRALIRDILAASRHGSADFLLDEDLEPSEHIRMVAKCRAFVGHKTHSVIMALATGTPVVAIAYHVKTEDFMKEYGLGEYCIPDEGLSPDLLNEKLRALLGESDSVGRREFDLSREFSAKIGSDFSSMLRMVST